MKYVDEFRDPAAARHLVEAIGRRATRCWTIMEVCGGQTHNLLRHGIDDALAGAVHLVHGPGCPVCVTGQELIDQAVALARRPGTCLATFGDMLRVPGSRQSLAQARTCGARVEAVYSPLDAVRLAQQQPDTEVVFFAVGFETTAPATALAVRQAARLEVPNFSLLLAHVRVEPAMVALVSMPGVRIDGFLAAGHVCTVIGYQSYEAFCRQYRKPVVVTGFEPVDLLAGILACVEQLEAGQHHVANCYGRCVLPEGNLRARALVDEVFEPCDRRWRGFDTIAQGGLRLRPPWARFDALQRLAPAPLPVIEPSLCRSGEVLAGKLKPTDCEHFGTRCHPDQPLGAPMVSSEGACAAYFLYHRPLAAP